MRDHGLFGLRGVNSLMARCSSSQFGLESTQPKHSASFTELGYGTNGPFLAFFYETSHASSGP